MDNLLSFLRPKKSRRAARPQGPALEPPPVRSPQPQAAAPQSCEVVDLASRRPAPSVWWPPLPPYICGFALGAALVTTAAVSITADAWAAQVQVAAQAFENWSV